MPTARMMTSKIPEPGAGSSRRCSIAGRLSATQRRSTSRAIRRFRFPAASAREIVRSASCLSDAASTNAPYIKRRTPSNEPGTGRTRRPAERPAHCRFVRSSCNGRLPGSACVAARARIRDPEASPSGRYRRRRRIPCLACRFQPNAPARVSRTSYRARVEPLHPWYRATQSCPIQTSRQEAKIARTRERLSGAADPDGEIGAVQRSGQRFCRMHVR